MNHIDNIEGEVTEETIFKQCKSMSNDNIHAFFNYSPHLDESHRTHAYVRLNNVRIYDSYDEHNYDKNYAEIIQDLIKIESEQANEH